MRLMLYLQCLKLYTAVCGFIKILVCRKKVIMKFFVGIFAWVKLENFLLKNKHVIAFKRLMNLLQECLVLIKLFVWDLFLQNKTRIAVRGLLIFLVIFFMFKQLSSVNPNLACLSVETEPADITLTLTSNKEYGLMWLRLEYPGKDLKSLLKTAGDIPSEGEFTQKDVYELCFLPKLVYVNGAEHGLAGNTKTVIRATVPRGEKVHIVIFQNAKLLSVYMGE